jgi:hypothetical protein
MLSDDDHQPQNVSTSSNRTVPKWPFLLGDVVLVIVALAISSSSGGLSTLQLFFCLGSVSLGAIIFVTPYVLENFPAAAGSIFANDVDQAGSAPSGESEWRRQARAAAEAVEHAARANAALEGSARRFDARFAPLAEVHQSLTAVVAELREATAIRASASAAEAQSVQREFERLRKEQAEKFKTAEEKIAELNEAIAILAGHIKTLSARATPADNSGPASARSPAKVSRAARTEEPTAIPVIEPALAAVGTAVSDAIPSAFVAEDAIITAEISTEAAVKVETASLGCLSVAPATLESPSVPSVEASEETSMLAKALARAQTSGQTPAVAGIIMARARRPRKTKSPIPVIETTPVVDAEAPAPVAAAEVTLPPVAPAEQEGWQSLSEGKFDAVTKDDVVIADDVSESVSTELPPDKNEPASGGDAGSAFRRSARAKIVALRGDDEEAARKDTPVVFTPNRPEEAASVLPADGPTQGELLAREAETIRRKRSSRSPVNACAITARVLIGIGNKPFVRGTGPGLSSDKGVPMEFVEIGQWRWVAPGLVKEPITLRILKNDEVPAEGDPIILHPGQSLDISPVFPG